MTAGKQKKLWFAAALYACIMLYLLLGRNPVVADAPYFQQLPQHLNMHPFDTIRRYFWGLSRVKDPQLLRWAFVNLFGNIILFAPLGFFLPSIWKIFRRLWRTLLAAAGIMALIELLQMLLLVGACDIDDIILNTFGASFGYGVYRLHVRKSPKLREEVLSPAQNTDAES